MAIPVLFNTRCNSRNIDAKMVYMARADGGPMYRLMSARSRKAVSTASHRFEVVNSSAFG